MSERDNSGTAVTGAPPSMRHDLVTDARTLWFFAPAVFLGAFLIFQIQPIVSKHILPWYGGAPSVWTTCVFVFQALLFAGYLYAHLSVRFLGRRWQVVVHLSLLLIAATIPILPTDDFRPTGSSNPLLEIVSMLLLTVGLPYFVLSASGPLLQAWFWRAEPTRSPYPLYALSNTGSLIALISYPFLVEPALSVSQQARTWWFVFAAFGLFCAACAWLLSRAAPLPAEREHGVAIGLEPMPLMRWIGWSGCSVVLFMAVTNQMSFDVPSVPFLWVTPLSIYLLTFIIAFAGRRWYARRWMVGPMVAALAGLYWIMQRTVEVAGGAAPSGPSIQAQIATYAAALFVLCLVCHGELYRLKPRPEGLTYFYGAIAFGGLLGGLIVGVVAPFIFVVYQELHLGMAGAVLLLVVGILKESTGEAVSRSRRTVVAAVSLGGLVLLVGLLARQTSSLLEGTVYVARNFFGVLRVQAVKSDTGAIRALELYDGAVLHGIQFLIPRLRSVPTTYYSELTGVGQVLRTYATTTGRRIGVVGLGAGVLAAYGRAGDVMRFYEINPNVVDVALNTFSFLKNSPARIETIIGDARLKLEQEPDQRFDILVLDAFSSDSIPVHLLTTEALVVYERHLAPGGVLLVHVSNLHLDLSALLHRQAAARKLPAIEFDNRARLDRATTPGRWVVLTHNQAFVDRLVAGMAPLIDSGDMQVFRRKPEDFAQLQPWSDDYSNLFQILN